MYELQEILLHLNNFTSMTKLFYSAMFQNELPEKETGYNFFSSVACTWFIPCLS